MKLRGLLVVFFVIVFSSGIAQEADTSLKGWTVRISFQKGSKSLNDHIKMVLQGLGKRMARQPTLTILLEGSEGNSKAHRLLNQERLNAVSRFISRFIVDSMNIDQGRFSYQIFGSAPRNQIILHCKADWK